MLNRTPPPSHPESPLDYVLSERGITQGNDVALLPGGAEAFPAMLAAIRVATVEVLLESYIFADDETGRAFLAALREAAGRGVAVRLIVDGAGSLALSVGRLAELERAGGMAMVYRPIAPWRARWGIWRRDHRKLLIVDRTIGFLGGLNIANEYDETTHSDRLWRDLHVRVEGPAAQALAALFIRTWNGENERTRWLTPVVEGAARSRGTAAVQVVGNDGLRSRSLIRRSFLYAVKRAQRAVYIANPYFIPDRHVSRALRRAARRGVEVRVVIPARSDILLTDLACRAALPALMRDGVHIAEWQAGMMHAKAASVDGRWATVGSYNLDHRSFRYNLEANANLIDAQLAALVEDRLRADFNASFELDLASFENRPLFLRAVEALAYRLRAWL